MHYGAPQTGPRNRKGTLKATKVDRTTVVGSVTNLAQMLGEMLISGEAG